MSKDKREHYLKETYIGKKLLETWPDLNYEATWAVYGEDPNPDFHGPHHEPVLGYYTGPLTKVIDIAINLPRFWTWGGGGRITCIEVKKIS